MAPLKEKQSQQKQPKLLKKNTISKRPTRASFNSNNTSVSCLNAALNDVYNNITQLLSESDNEINDLQLSKSVQSDVGNHNRLQDIKKDYNDMLVNEVEPKYRKKKSRINIQTCLTSKEQIPNRKVSKGDHRDVTVCSGNDVSGLSSVKVSSKPSNIKTTTVVNKSKKSNGEQIQNNLKSKMEVNCEPYVFNTSILVKDQNTEHVDNKKINESKLLGPIVNDLYFNVKCMEESREQIQEIEEIEEITVIEDTDKSYLIHLSLDQTLKLDNGGSFLIKKGLIPLDIKISKVCEKDNYCHNRDVSKEDLGKDKFDSDINVKRLQSKQC